MNTTVNTDFEKCCQSYYDKFVGQIRNLGFSDNVTMSVTDYGCSLYFFLGERKCRLSDHSVTNTYRMSNETHYSKIEDAVLAVEKHLFPERFEKVIVGKLPNGMELFKLIRK